jgi:hypothetical protein
METDSLYSAFKKALEQEKGKEQYTFAAQEFFKCYSSLIEAGFSKKQAFTIIVTQIQAIK